MWAEPLVTPLGRAQGRERGQGPSLSLLKEADKGERGENCPSETGPSCAVVFKYPPASRTSHTPPDTFNERDKRHESEKYREPTVYCGLSGGVLGDSGIWRNAMRQSAYVATPSCHPRCFNTLPRSLMHRGLLVARRKGPAKFCPRRDARNISAIFHAFCRYLSSITSSLARSSISLAEMQCSLSTTIPSVLFLPHYTLHSHPPSSSSS